MSENRTFQPIRSLTDRVRRNHEPADADVTRPVESTPSERVRARASVVDSAVYVDGDRVASPGSLADTSQALPRRAGRHGLDRALPARPTRAGLASPSEFDLHELAVEDAIVAHQRPKLERYGDTLFVVLRAARYLDDVEEVEFGELHVFVGPGLRDHRPARRGARPVGGAPPDGESTPNCSAWARRRSCTPSSTRWSTATPRSSPGCRTTSTRSRPRSSAATRRSPGASTSCPAR